MFKTRRKSFGYGTGYLIAPQLALTARHVVDHVDTLSVRTGLQPSGWSTSAEPVWTGAGEVDLALVALVDAPSLDVGPPAFGEMIPLPGIDSSRRKWEFRCTGFPALQAGQLTTGRPYRDSSTLRGTAHLDWNLRSGLITLTVTDSGRWSGSDWRGISGAPVFVHDWLVGVVVQADRTASILRAVPIASVLGNRHLNLAGFVEPAKTRAAFLGLLEHAGVPASIHPAHRQPYRDTFRQVHGQCPELRDRGVELTRLRSWARSSTTRFAVWTGRPWSGKTALAAALASSGPAAVDYVTYFVSRARRQNSSNGVIASLADQLAALVDEPRPLDPELDFDRLLTTVTIAAEHAGRHLVLIVDGLDEMDDREGIRNLVARLPSRPRPRLSILLFTGPSIRVEDFVEPGHPLAQRATCEMFDLPPSRHAEDSFRRAEGDMEYVLDAGGATRRALQAIAMLGPLSLHELTEVLALDGSGTDEVRTAFRTATSRRLVVTVPEFTQARYALSHDALREVAEKSIGPAEKGALQHRVIALGDFYRDKDWPEETPDLFFLQYLSLLARIGDTTRLAETALSTEWHGVHRRRFSREIDSVSTVRSALLEAGNARPDDVAALLAVGLQFTEPSATMHNYPYELVQAWAMAGELGMARSRTERFADPERRATALADVATILLAQDDPRASGVVERAATAALSVDSERGTFGLRSLRFGMDNGSSPSSAPCRRLSLLLRLTPLAYHVGRLGLAGELNEASWTDITTLAIGSSTISTLLTAAKFAAALGDHEHLRTVLDGLDDSQITVDLRRQLATNTHPDDDGLPSMPEPEPLTASLPYAETAAPSSSANEVELHRIATALGRAELHDAAELIESFFPTVEGHLDAARGYSHKIADLARFAAQEYGRDATSVVEAADRFAIREGLQQEAPVWTAWSGGLVDHGPNGLISDHAGRFLSECVHLAASAGLLDEVLREVPSDGPRRALDLVTACVAVGAARAGDVTVALRLLDRVRNNIYAARAWDQLALLWSDTNRWRDAARLLAGRSTHETHLIAARAVAHAIKIGEVQAGLDIASAWRDNPYLTPCRVVAARELAARGFLEVALEQLTEDDTVEVWLDLLHEAGTNPYTDANLRVIHLSAVLRNAGLVPREMRVGLLLRTATALLDLRATERAASAQRSAMHTAWRIKGRVDRWSAFIDLADSADELSRRSRTKLIALVVNEAANCDDDGVNTVLSASVAAALEAHEPDLAWRATDVLIGRRASVGEISTAVQALCAYRRPDRARALLSAATEVEGADNSFLPSDEPTARYSTAARVALEAGLTADASIWAERVNTDMRSNLLSDLATTALDKGDLNLARRFALEALVTGVTPRLLSVAVRLEPGLGPSAVRWFVREGTRAIW